MDALSNIFIWLSEHEAAISAVAAIIVIAGVVFAGFRWLVSRRDEPAKESSPEDDPLLALPTGPVVAVLPFYNLGREQDVAPEHRRLSAFQRRPLRLLGEPRSQYRDSTVIGWIGGKA